MENDRSFVDPNDGVVVILCCANVDVMLIPWKGLWDDGKELVDFNGDFFVIVRKQFLKSCLVEFTFINVGGEFFKAVPRLDFA